MADGLYSDMEVSEEATFQQLAQARAVPKSCKSTSEEESVLAGGFASTLPHVALICSPVVSPIECIST